MPPEKHGAATPGKKKENTIGARNGGKLKELRDAKLTGLIKPIIIDESGSRKKDNKTCQVTNKLKNRAKKCYQLEWGRTLSIKRKANSLRSLLQRAKAEGEKGRKGKGGPENQASHNFRFLFRAQAVGG